MAIEIGQNPEGVKGINKFIARSGEGHRGKIIALHESKKRAIVLSMNTSFEKKGGVVWGKLYLVEEENPDEYPKVVEGVSSVPNSEEWTVV